MSQAESITLTRADTSTVTYTRSYGDKDMSEYRADDDSYANPHVLTFKRVYPKPQGDFPGVARIEAKLSHYRTNPDTGKASPVITTWSMAVPAFVSDADRDDDLELLPLLLGTASVMDDLVGILEI